MFRGLLQRLATPPQGGNQVAPQRSADDAWASLLIVNDWIKHAEAKLGIVFALVGLLAAGVIALISDVAQPTGTLLTAALISALLITCSAASATIGLVPKFKPQKTPHALNPLFYGDVAKHFGRDELGYTRHFQSVISDQEALTQQIARQVWINSEVAARKLKWANRATILGVLAVFATAATGIIAVRWS